MLHALFQNLIKVLKYIFVLLIVVVSGEFYFIGFGGISLCRFLVVVKSKGSMTMVGHSPL